MIGKWVCLFGIGGGVLFVAKYFAFDPAASVTPKQSPILP